MEKVEMFRDADGVPLQDPLFQADKAFYNLEDIPGSITIDESRRSGNDILVISYNVNGCGARAYKLGKMIQEVEYQLGRIPDVALIQKTK